MKIAAIQRTSFVDYPGKIAAVVFTQGCNLNCSYCHNRALIDGDSITCDTPQEEALAWLETRHELLDAVVFSGGEPMLQLDLTTFIEQLRRLDYFVKLDTNGTSPAMLNSLIRAGLLDYVAMDIKAPPEKYESICGVPLETSAVEQSIDILLEGTIDYEFRTTVVPQLTHADILAIAQRILGARLYVLQQYRRPVSGRPLLDRPLKGIPHSHAWVQEVMVDIKSLVRNCGARGFDITGLPPVSQAEMNLRLLPH